jgi:isopentenyl-diphosphate delta-isomerase
MKKAGTGNTCDELNYKRAMREEVILVDNADNEVGVMEKMEAHEKALLHRAFSVFIFNDGGEMLLQQRALAKYHSGGLWTNACCSHPRPGELTIKAAERRLQEELGFYTTIRKIFDFTYKAAFDNGLTEHEFDHVFVGTYNETIRPNPAEVQDTRFMLMDDILQLLQADPGRFTAWFHIAFPRIYEWWQSNHRPA